jgi:hypothetical protein
MVNSRPNPNPVGAGEFEDRDFIIGDATVRHTMLRKNNTK